MWAPRAGGRDNEAIKDTPNNELSRPLFVINVIEMIMACAMEPLSERLIELVGPKSGGP